MVSAGSGVGHLELELPPSRASRPQRPFPSPAFGPLCVRGMKHTCLPVSAALPDTLDGFWDEPLPECFPRQDGKGVSPTNACFCASALSPDPLQPQHREGIVLQGIETPPTGTWSLPSPSAGHKGNAPGTSLRGGIAHHAAPHERWDQHQEALSLIFVAIVIQPRCFSITKHLEGSLIS